MLNRAFNFEIKILYNPLSAEPLSEKSVFRLFNSNFVTRFLTIDLT